VADDTSFTHYTSPANFMSQSGGYSAMGPPWSTLTAYDLNSGTIRWQVPNGGITALEKEGHSDTGARDPRGGPVVTAGGLIFAATASDHKIRAYDEDTGKVLWEYETPTGSDGVPAVYEAGGREYIAFCVAGGDGLNLGGRGRGPTDAAPPPNAYMVFALPKN
jgi:quinoprotein glucose dehydrogenase